MAGGNVEVVRGVYDAFAKGRIDDALALLAPDVEWRAAQDTRVYEGREDVRKSLSSYADVWDLHGLEVEELTEVGGDVVAEVRRTGVARHSGIELESRYFQVWTVDDGHVRRFQEYGTREEALGAARRGG